jgi:hypothetical protein
MIKKVLQTSFPLNFRFVSLGSARVLGDANVIKEGKVVKRVRNRLVGR